LWDAALDNPPGHHILVLTRPPGRGALGEPLTDPTQPKTPHNHFLGPRSGESFAFTVLLAGKTMIHFGICDGGSGAGEEDSGFADFIDAGNRRLRFCGDSLRQQNRS
jgi:hypothetical protein